MADMAVNFAGLKFRSPVITGSGPNVRDGEMCRRALAGGAGAVVTKTISTRPAPVPRPNMALYGMKSMLNTELWTELTSKQWLEKEIHISIKAAREYKAPIIASIGYTAEDVRELGPKVQKAGVDAIELPVHYLQSQTLDEPVRAAKALRRAVSIPIFSKFSLRYGDPGDFAAALAPYVDGFVCINSVGPSLAINIERCEPVMGNKFGYGWMSGEAIKPLAVRSVFEVAKRVKKPIIGLGGIYTGEDAAEFMMAGATAVGICTGVLYRGHSLYGRVVRELSKWLDRHGHKSLADIRGLYVKKYGSGQRVVTKFEEAPVVDRKLCIACTRCEPVCFYDAISAPPKVKAKVFPAKCTQCGLCVTVCPTGALSFQPRDKTTLQK